MEKQTVNVGDSVTYVDCYGYPRPAVVTAVWGSKEFIPATKENGIVKYPSSSSDHPPCVNLAFVNPNDKMTDQYGRQILRESSVSHASTVGSCHGRYWHNNSDVK